CDVSRASSRRFAPPAVWSAPTPTTGGARNRSQAEPEPARDLAGRSNRSRSTATATGAVMTHGGVMIDLRGVIPATVLPMTHDAAIDEPELRRYIRWIAGQGIRAVAVNVDTGEGPHLWHDERLRVLSIYREELAGRGIPIVAGLGASFTAQAVKYALEYREA